MSSGQVIATIHIRMIPAGDDQRILFAVEDIFKTALGCSSQCVIQIEREGANNSSGGGGGVGHRKQSLSHFEEIHPKIAPAHSTLNIGFEMHHHQNNNNNDSINANFIHHPSLHHHHHHPSSNHTH